MFAGLIPLLAFGPYAFAVPRDVMSASAYEGYSTGAAYGLAAGWLALSVAAAGLLVVPRSETRGRVHRHDTGADHRVAIGQLVSVVKDRSFWLVAGITFALVVMFYFPPFLAASGSLFEANIHLTALHRMLGGQRPYTDFEYLYGPLMLFPAHVWMRGFGYSLGSFYSYVALLEALEYAFVVAVVWWLVPDRKSRWFALAVLGALMFNVLIGPNWSASRRILGLVGILAVAAAPLRPRVVLVSVLLLGMQLAYSHDVGVASIAGAAVVYTLLAFTAERRRAIPVGLVVTLGAIVVWFLISRALLGDGFGDYVRESADLAARFSAGEAGFRFYWTVNSLALFGVLVFAAIHLGTGLVKKRGVRPTRADLLLAAGFAFAMIALKSGLNRADMWHLDATVVPLALALLIPGRDRFAFSRRGVVFARALLALVAATYLFGLLPSLRFVGAAWARGAAVNFGAAVPRAMAVVPITPAPVLDLPLTDSGSLAYKLAWLLACPEWLERPVVFYAGTWRLAKRIGRYKIDPLNDDFIYSNERGLRFRRFLEARPDALVLIDRRVFNRLFDLADRNTFPEYFERFHPTTAKRIAGWLSSTHYHGLAIEAKQKDERWRGTVGQLLLSRYREVAHVGRIVVLAPLTSAK